MKKNLIILALAIIVLAVIIILTNKVKPVPVENPTNESSSTVGVNEEIDSINVDVGIDEDMKTIDADLENL